jgi:hypothetical protein
MRRLEDLLPDVLLVLDRNAERRVWKGQGSLPLSVRISERLADMLIAASELQADLETDEAGPLRAIAPEVDRVVARIETLLRKLAT